jgi:hypothetical protein
MTDSADSTQRPADDAEATAPPEAPHEPDSARASEPPSGPASDRASEPTSESTSSLDGGVPPATPPAPPIAPPISPPIGPVPAATPPGHGRDGRDGSWVGGVVLIAIGVAFLLGQLLPNAGRFVPLLVGLIFLAVFLATRNYGFLVPGGIVTGVGVGIVLTMEDQGRVGGGLFLISLGFGFVGIFILAALFRLRENHPWPLIPGGILCTIGLITLGGTRYDEVARVAWPAVLIALGLLFVLRGLLRRPPA